MDVIVEFNEAAFRHNISKEDIYHALRTKIHDFTIGEHPEKNDRRRSDCFQRLFY